MEKDKRKYRICFIDYMWYVAEIWSEREHNNLNGRMLLFCAGSMLYSYLSGCRWHCTYSAGL